ncbi:hypothetical protein ID866_4370 [Astraeus odoratus]|nr:hypothetical protein ID866_4370 [Astraeus odoratus]
MSSRQELPAKRPAGARAPPARLVSLPTHSRRVLCDSQEVVSSQVDLQSSSSTSLGRTNHDTQEPVVESPQPTSAEEFGHPLTASIHTPQSAKRSFSPLFAQVFKPSNASSSGQSPDPTNLAPSRTPSKARWEQLRQHVVPSTVSYPASPAPSSQGFVPGSPVPLTPKTSRFARLGLRQVVDHVREAAVDDSRMLADEILKVCWSFRLDTRIGKPEREGTSIAMGSSLQLPFISNVSLHSAPASAGSPLVPNYDLPQPTSTSLTGRGASQIFALHQTIIRYASRYASYLPHESLVLGTLLRPFLPDRVMQWTTEDHCTAVEAFEVAVKIWRPASAEVSPTVLFANKYSPSQVGIERCIWCCNAARGPTLMRSRIIGILRSLLHPRTGPIEFRSHGAFVSLVQSLLITLISLLEEEPKEPKNPDVVTVRELIEGLWSGKCGSLASYLADAEVDGHPVMLDGVNEVELRDALISEAVVQCCKISPPWFKSRAIASLLEDYWRPLSLSTPFCPLIAITHSRRLLAFSDVFVALTSSLSARTGSSTGRCGVELIAFILESRVNQEIKLMSERYSANVMKRIISSLLEVLWTDSLPVEDSDRILNLLVNYFKDEQWSPSVENAIHTMITDEEWLTTCRITEALFKLPETVRNSIFSIIIPALQERIIFDPPPDADASLTGILEKVSRLHPQVFFKPLFSCAASSKVLSAVRHLQQLVALSIFLPDFWLHDPDIVVVALMNEVGSVQQEAHETCRKATVGQNALLIELIMLVKHLTAIDTAGHVSPMAASAARYFSSLEARLGVMLEAKVKTTLAGFRHIFRINVGENDPDTAISTHITLHSAVRYQASNPFAEAVVSSSLTTEEYNLLGPFLWQHTSSDAGSLMAQSTAFLIMQCGERASAALIDAITGDLQSYNESVKVKAIRRMDTLIAMRFQILHQHFIQDRNRRRPFRSARDPLPFIATSIGSSLFVQEQGHSEEEGGMPPELRKRLAEVGWFTEEPADKRREWIRTPLSVLPLHAVDRMVGEDRQILSSPSFNDHVKTRSNGDISDPALSTRTSDSTGRSGKRRTIFIPVLAALFPRLIAMVSDPHLEVASAARDCILHALRTDPALVLRPVFDLVAGNKMDDAVTTLRGLLHLQHMLPPAAAHYSFNHLVGYMKSLVREINVADPLREMAVTSTLISDLAAQVSEMSLREVRRAKVEIFLVPSGSLWFLDGAPVGPMFPRAIAPNGGIADRLSMLTAITMVRVSQNKLSLALLRKHPQDAPAIRKGMKWLHLPSLGDSEATPQPLNCLLPLPLKSRMPTIMTSSHIHTNILSSLLSRSYLLLTVQIFKSMSRNVSDRNELATFIDGINRILLVHASDIDIVTHALIGKLTWCGSSRPNNFVALMVASTRFKRLFTSGAGYPFFMLVLIKVYAEQEGNQTIRQAIEYAVNRFYAIHQETFLFQTLDVVAHTIMAEGCDSAGTMTQVHQLLSSLRYDNCSIALPDASGIRNSTKLQEKEALILTTAEEKPQTFIASIRLTGTNEKKLVIDLPEEYASVALLPENIIRLLLTVIAHDPSIYRAQCFLRLLRLSVQTMYNVSKSTRNVLRDGADAIGSIVMRVHPKFRGSEITPSSINDNAKPEAPEDTMPINSLQAKSKSPSDITSMRLDFLHLVLGYLRCGGQVLATTSQKFFETAKIVLREAVGQEEQVAEVMCQYAQCFLNRTGQQSIKEVVAFLEIVSPIIKAHGSSADFGGIYEAITHIISDNRFANDPRFCQVLVTQVCRAGLAAHAARCSGGWMSFHLNASPLIGLVARTMFIRVDAAIEIEQHPLTYHFMTGVVLPLVSSLGSGGYPTGIHESRHHNVHSEIWMRLLSYVLRACQSTPQSTPTSPPENRKSQDKSGHYNEETVMTIVAALQVLKVICVNAVEVISSLHGIWPRIATVFKSLLTDGDASFAFGGADLSAPPSPAQSPHHSIASFDPFNGPDTLRPSVVFDFSRALNQPSPPRLIDYLLWSLMELLCLCRSPLMLHLRLLIQEKVLRLDDDIRSYQSGSFPSARERRMSSVFSKPRKRRSGAQAGLAPPRSPSLYAHSPISPADGSPRTLNVDVNMGRRAGFERSPTTSPGGPSHLPHIIHLGPAQPLTYRRSTSPTGMTRMSFKNATIKSPKLIQATYRRIRLVQASMGYDLLLPMPAVMEADEEFDTIKAWTKRQAIDALMREMEELIEEYSESRPDDSMVIIDPDESITFG